MFRKLHDPGPATVTVHIDGRPVRAEVGESIAALLLRQPEGWSRTTPVSESRRAPVERMIASAVTLRALPSRVRKARKPGSICQSCACGS